MDTMTTTAARSAGRARSLAPALIVAAAIVAAAIAVPLLWSEGSSTRSITLFEPDGSGPTELVDLAEADFSVGDTFLERHQALDPATGEELGTIVRQLQVVELLDEGDFRFLVHVAVSLADGQIVYSGSATYGEIAAGTAVVSITGGTGAYAGARGTVGGSFTERDGEPGLELRFEVTV